MTQILMKCKDIKKLKEKIWVENNRKCPLLGIAVPIDKMVLDHAHKLKSEAPSQKKGAVRGALEFRANALEGKITNNWKRYFGADETKHPIDLPGFLRNLADYLESGCYHDNNGYYIHPSEVPKEPLLQKSSYAALKKCYNGTAKFPDYPKSKKLTSPLRKLFELYNIEPKFYK